jgi:excisionase family DNA binding protein
MKTPADYLAAFLNHLAAQPDAPLVAEWARQLLQLTARQRTEEPAAEPTMTMAEVAEALRVNRETVMRWVRRGILPAPARMGRQLRFRWVAVEQAIRAREVLRPK